jgi:hypothetical protein
MNDRRTFLKGVAAAGAGLCIGGRWLARGDAFAAIEPAVKMTGATRDRLPTLSVRGDATQIGEAIGGEWGMETQAIFYDRRKWFQGLKKYAKSREGKKNVLTMRGLAEKHTPKVMAELAGWSKRCGVSLDDLFLMNIKNEIDAFSNRQEGCPGCSTVALQSDKGIWLLHNEDGHPSFEGRMLLLEARPAEEAAFISLTYPGIVSGNAWWLNEHGVFMTTNYIPSAKVRAGIPRYFLYRKALAADSVEAALTTLTHAERAYAGHHYLGSLATRELKSVEITPDKVSIQDVKGLSWHTNHLVHDAMKGECQFQKYVTDSSLPRYARLTELLGGAAAPSLGPDLLHKALSDHESTPTTLCRHAPPDPVGMTLGMALFESKTDARTVGPFRAQFIKGFPCEDQKAAYTVG